MQNYVCQVCGYVYDPAIGDPDNGVNPAPHLKTCLPTGYARCVERTKTVFRLNKEPLCRSISVIEIQAIQPPGRYHCGSLCQVVPNSKGPGTRLLY